MYSHSPSRLCFLFVYILSTFSFGFVNVELNTGLVPLCKHSKETTSSSFFFFKARIDHLSVWGHLSSCQDVFGCLGKQIYSRPKFVELAYSRVRKMYKENEE